MTAIVPAGGEVIIVRYADDLVIGFREKSEARRCLVDLQERFAKFGLALHSEKPRLIKFGRHSRRDAVLETCVAPEQQNPRSGFLNAAVQPSIKSDSPVKSA